MLPDMRLNTPGTTPAQEDPTLPPVSSLQLAAPAFSWRGWDLLLRILGIVMAFGGGIAVGYAATSSEISSAVSGWWTLLALVVGGALFAMLFRSWAAILILPVVFSGGVFLGTIIQGGGFDFQKWLPTAAEATYILVIFGDLPLLLGVVIGTPLGKRLEQRIRR